MALWAMREPEVKAIGISDFRDFAKLVENLDDAGYSELAKEAADGTLEKRDPVFADRREIEAIRDALLSAVISETPIGVDEANDLLRRIERSEIWR